MSRKKPGVCSRAEKADGVVTDGELLRGYEPSPIVAVPHPVLAMAVITLIVFR